ncbi:MAG: sigma-54 dependent transcriptional regulator [Nitrospirales bacterium]|nr:sigma-54 dependent transcriptional regulator [Nitrospirales bacterium]HQU28119.1 sigma-54 dependent transcriptional regulator [Nitrospirales bacterium]
MPLVSPPKILIVDDEPDTLTLLREIMEKEGYEVRTAGSGASALESFPEFSPDLVLSDIQMPNMDGLALLAETRKRSPLTQVILLTAYGSLSTAVEGIKAGAFDYLSKPFSLEEIRGVVRRAIEHKHMLEASQATSQPLLRKEEGIHQIQGKSPAMVSVYKLIARVAPTESTVLIHGETGTGKELIARAIHANSLRREGPFVAVDCGTLAENLLESELFGHERGAFTGALTLKKGLMESANQGTCFLDEIGDISPNLQSKLLRVLQEHEIRRVGGMESIKVDVRIIAATNKNLKTLVAAGKFREDLFYRLNVVMVHLPPLRDRKEDLPTLIHYFLDKYTRVNNKAIHGVHPQAMTLLMQYQWPGNIRELEHTIERAIVMTPHSVIMPHDLPLAVVAPPPSSEPVTTSSWKTLEQLEREHLLKVLDAQQGDENRTADILGIHRKTLQRKLKEYGLR